MQGYWQPGAVSLCSTGTPDANAMDSIFEPRIGGVPVGRMQPVRDVAAVWHSSNIESLRNLTGASTAAVTAAACCKHAALRLHLRSARSLLQAESSS